MRASGETDRETGGVERRGRGDGDMVPVGVRKSGSGRAIDIKSWTRDANTRHRTGIYPDIMGAAVEIHDILRSGAGFGPERNGFDAIDGGTGRAVLENHIHPIVGRVEAYARKTAGGTRTINTVD